MRNLLLVLNIVLLAILGACAGSSHRITPDDALELIADNEEAVLLDVRTETEFRESHIDGAILVPLAVLAETIEDVAADRQTAIIVYCRSGNRSKDAVDVLIKMGYENVHDLGGILDWPYEVVAD